MKINTKEYDNVKDLTIDEYVNKYKPHSRYKRYRTKNEERGLYCSNCNYHMVGEVEIFYNKNSYYTKCPKCDSIIYSNYIDDISYINVKISDYGDIIYNYIVFDVIGWKKLHYKLVYDKNKFINTKYKDIINYEEEKILRYNSSIYNNKIISIIISKSHIDILKSVYPYSGIDVLVKEIDPNAYTISLYYIIRYLSLWHHYPYVEQLLKSKYKKIIIDIIRTPSKESLLKRNFQNGTNLKQIIKIPLYIADDIIETTTDPLTYINEWRILLKETTISKDLYIQYTKLNINKEGVKKFKKIIKEKYHTVESLINYLERADIYQALEPNIALELLDDYIRMCKIAEVNPNVKTHSLRKAHDVMARIVQYVFSDEVVKKFDEVASYIKSFEYSNEHFRIIAPVNINDMVNEGRAMNNCIASYVELMAEKESYIMFLRKDKEKDTPYVDIAINPQTLMITQKYRKSNMLITDKKTLDFLQEYQDFLYSKLKQKAS